jgi:glycerophosphoryl diester phosphodiesterase
MPCYARYTDLQSASLPNTQARPALAVAHKGGNHLAALGAAEAIGADMVEADIWLHRGRLELRHATTMGKIPLMWDDWRLHAAWLPRLELPALLAAAEPNTAFMFDLKGGAPRLPAELIEAMRTLAPGRPYSVCGQNWDLLDPFRDEPNARVIHSIGNARMLRDVRERVRDIAQPAVSVDFRVLTAERVAYLREFVPLIISWIINLPEHFRLALDWGVNGITSDNLVLLRQLTALRNGYRAHTA